MQHTDEFTLANLVTQYGVKEIKTALQAIEDIDKPKMNALIPFDRCVVYARRWFQSSYGNTYHSCKVYIDGELIGQLDFAYGYDDQYRQTAHTILQAKGYYAKTVISLPSGASKDYCEFSEDTREHREKFDFQVVDVERKKDL